MKKNLSLILAIVMLAMVFCAAMPLTVAAAEDYEIEFNGQKMNFADLHSEVMPWIYLVAAQEDVTIKLLKNVDTSSFKDGYFPIYADQLKADKTPVKFVFDGNGYTLTTNTGNFFRLGGKGAAPTATNNVTIKNLNIEYNGVGSVVQVYSGGDFALENVVMNITTVMNWTAFNANMNDNTGNPANVTFTNVIMNMGPNGSTNMCSSFVRTGNQGLADKNAETNVYHTDKSPIVNYVFNNCFFNAPGKASTEPTKTATDGTVTQNPGVRAVDVTSGRSKIVANNCTFIAPTSFVGYERFFPGNDRTTDEIKAKPGWVTLNDCVIDESGNNGVAVKLPIIGSGLEIVNDDAAVENGFKQFEMVKPGESGKLPELDTDIVAELYLAGTETPVIQVMRKDFVASFANAGNDLLSSDPRVQGADVTIEILRDINVGNNQCRFWATLGKTVTVNGNGHTVYGEVGGNPIFRYNSSTGGGAVVINDLDLYNKSGSLIQYYNGVEVTLNNCDWTSETHMGAYLTGFGTLNLVNSTFTTASHTINGQTGNTSGNIINIDEDSALICTGAGKTINLEKSEFTTINIAGEVKHTAEGGVAVFQAEGRMTNIVAAVNKKVAEAVTAGAIEGIEIIEKVVSDETTPDVTTPEPDVDVTTPEPDVDVTTPEPDVDVTTPDAGADVTTPDAGEQTPDQTTAKPEAPKGGACGGIAIAAQLAALVLAAAAVMIIKKK